MTDVLQEVIDQCQQIIKDQPKCEQCGLVTDTETLFKAQDRLLKAYALQHRIQPPKTGEAFNE